MATFTSNIVTKPALTTLNQELTQNMVQGALKAEKAIDNSDELKARCGVISAIFAAVLVIAFVIGATSTMGFGLAVMGGIGLTITAIEYYKKSKAEPEKVLADATQKRVENFLIENTIQPEAKPKRGFSIFGK